LKNFIILILLILFVPVGIIYADTQSTTSRGSTLIDFGPLDIEADYEVGFNIIAPFEIRAGDTADITVIPTYGKVTPKISLSGKNIGSFPTDMNLGQEVRFGIPGGYGLGLFAKTVDYVQPLVKGPAEIIYSKPVLTYDSMIAKSFKVSVNENIGNYDSITIELPARMITTYGADIDLIITKEHLTSNSNQFGMSMISLKIPLKKTYDTDLSLDVRDGTCTGCIQVKPILTYDGSQTLHSTQIVIYVDGKMSQSGLTSNQWSLNFSPGTGSHLIKAEYLGDRSSSNKAIFYSSSSDSESFTVKTPTSSQSSSQKTQNSLKCGSGTHEENGLCIPDSLFGGGCLIATATYGSELAPQVQQLRELRDNSLLQTQSGTSFMTGFNQFYYSFSPTIADYERENPLFKEGVRLFITPMISTLSIMTLADDSEFSVLGLGISVILLNLGIYVVGPVFGISKLKSRLQRKQTI